MNPIKHPTGGITEHVFLMCIASAINYLTLGDTLTSVLTNGP